MTALEEQLLWEVGGPREMRRPVSTVHARVRQSPAITAWHHTFHTMTEGLLRDLLKRAGTSGPSVEAEVKIAVFAIEGMLTHELDESQQQAICRRLAVAPVQPQRTERTVLPRRTTQPNPKRLGPTKTTSGHRRVAKSPMKLSAPVRN